MNKIIIGIVSTEHVYGRPIVVSAIEGLAFNQARSISEETLNLLEKLEKSVQKDIGASNELIEKYKDIITPCP